MGKAKRLDECLIEQEIVISNEEAFVMVTEGRVFVNGQKAVSPAQIVSADAHVEVREGAKYVGRGALKLKSALEKFGIGVQGKICADIGAATGGFTQVLLEAGAKRVYAIDTARGKLALQLRDDPAVVVMEKTDVRDVKELPELLNYATIDVSLVSLRDILPHVSRFLLPEGEVIALFKPQYETRDPKALVRGVIKDRRIREKLLRDFMEWAGENGWEIKEWMESPIRGSEGNGEYLFYLKNQ